MAAVLGDVHLTWLIVAQMDECGFVFHPLQDVFEKALLKSGIKRGPFTWFCVQALP